MHTEWLSIPREMRKFHSMKVESNLKISPVSTRARDRRHAEGKEGSKRCDPKDWKTVSEEYCECLLSVSMYMMFTQLICTVDLCRGNRTQMGQNLTAKFSQFGAYLQMFQESVCPQMLWVKLWNHKNQAYLWVNTCNNMKVQWQSIILNIHF